ncbi:MAG: YggS family pyridoxal phosphate-dependent enzyme [Candidatus Aminicenantes bacterium]|nr:YggS family pyridoxal phosphate-dependent enzyme [Candidatus Aminicenantes bacterium]
MDTIKENIKKILDELPDGVELVAAAKARTPEQVNQAVEAGIKIIGENYVQEAEKAFNFLGKKARWHFIGHLQRNKVKKAIRIFDMIETVDSMKLAKEIETRAEREDLVMPVLIEVNSGREEQKFGVFPQDVEEFARKIAEFDHLKLQGLMTMGPMVGDPENARPYFVETRKVFEKLKKLSIPSAEMKYLSMGMTNSYKIAVEEGANIVRIGTKIFGPR